MSDTYNDLPLSMRIKIGPAEWQHMEAAEQRDWIIARLKERRTNPAERLLYQSCDIPASIQSPGVVIANLEKENEKLRAALVLSDDDLGLVREVLVERVAEWSNIIATAKPPTEKMWKTKEKWDDLLHRVKHEQKRRKEATK